MEDKIIIICQWGARNDGLEGSSERVHHFFESLASETVVLSEWTKVPRSLKKPVSTQGINIRSKDAVIELLLKGRNLTDVAPRVPIDDLGYSFTLWNRGLGGFSVILSITCSIFNINAGLNSVRLTFERISQNFLTVKTIINIIKTMIYVWDPSIGAVYFDNELVYQSRLNADNTQLLYFEKSGYGGYKYWKKLGSAIENYKDRQIYIQEKILSNFETWNFEFSRKNSKC